MVVGWKRLIELRLLLSNPYPGFTRPLCGCLFRSRSFPRVSALSWEKSVDLLYDLDGKRGPLCMGGRLQLVSACDGKSRWGRSKTKRTVTTICFAISRGGYLELSSTTINNLCHATGPDSTFDPPSTVQIHHLKSCSITCRCTTPKKQRLSNLVCVLSESILCV